MLPNYNSVSEKAHTVFIKSHHSSDAFRSHFTLKNVLIPMSYMKALGVKGSKINSVFCSFVMKHILIKSVV